MVTLEATTREYEGVTLVEATLSNDGPDARLVRVESELDGPVWPPRREGVPEAGWDPDEGTLAATLSPGERIGVGFASPAAPADPPLTVVADRPADGDGGRMDSPTAVVRTLGDPSPPGDAVPGPPPDETRNGEGDESDPSDARDDHERSADGDHDRERRGDRSRARSREDGPARSGEGGSRRGDGSLGTRVGGFPAVTAWLDAVERRIDDARGDTGPGHGTLDADAERLRAVGRRAVALAERADETTERPQYRTGKEPQYGTTGGSP